VRIATRTVAVCAGYLFVTGGLLDSERGRTKVMQALQVARQILAFYLFCSAYMVWISGEDRLAHIKNIPGGVVMIYIVIALYAIPGICIYGGYEAGYFGRIVAWLLVIITVLVDYNTKYWIRSSAHVDFWCQIQHASRNISVIGSLLLLARIRLW
ncbi:PREDICTED: transmembrane protein 101-like, partial [Acropora digitifera]